MKEKQQSNYKIRVDQQFIDDLKFIRQNNLVDPADWGLFQSQIKTEFKDLDEDWEKLSRKTDFGDFSTFGYRKRYVHSIPLREKRKRGWQHRRSDVRIIFKVDEENKEIYYLRIGKRIKGYPKDPMDVWERSKHSKLPEHEQI